MGIQATGWAAQNAEWQLRILDQLRLRGVSISEGAYATLAQLYQKGLRKTWAPEKTKHPLPSLDDHGLTKIAGKAPGLNRERYEALR